MKVPKAPLVSILLFGSAAMAQNYVGDTVCSGCHTDNPYEGFFDAYIASGHPWKLFQTGGEVPDAETYPMTDLPPLPMAFGAQLEWSDVEYIIGNYFWKARFVDPEGYIWTGNETDTTQWNLATQGWVPYHPGETRPYNCGRCHTTGYDPEGNQNDLPGLIGTWTEEGIRCEACHGPGSDHIGDPQNTPPPGGKACSDCHYRDSEFRMPWKGGFTRHHQQSEDFSHSAHNDVVLGDDSEFTCNTCHNPHRSTVYEDGGLIKQCTDCHEGTQENNYYQIGRMGDITCADCHMPYMGKSAVAFNDYKGDIKGHLFRIMTEPIAAADNVYDDGTGNLFWNQDEEGESAATLDYACLGCHEEVGPPLTIEQAAILAEDIHTGPFATFDTSLHNTRAGKNFWYGVENGGFETFTGVGIDELGCEDCHGMMDANGQPYGDDYEPDCADCHATATDGSVSQSQCLSCHGRQKTEINLGYTDVHRDSGNPAVDDCWDCHTGNDLHGNGTPYDSMLQPGAIEADCENCHTEPPEGHAVYDPVAHGGKIHCTSCHAQTVISCYNCHFESQVESHVKRAHRPISNFVILVNREKDGKIYPGSFQSLTYQGDSFVAFGPFSPHSITAEGRTCTDCHVNFGGENESILEYNETGQIKFASWDDEAKLLSWKQGIVPLPRDYQVNFRMDFLTYTGDTANPPGPDFENWTGIGEDIWDGHQLFFATPLSWAQMENLGFENLCYPDTDGNGMVDVDDLVNVILAWGTDDPNADIDGSGTVDVDDLVAVILAWGVCP